MEQEFPHVLHHKESANEQANVGAECRHVYGRPFSYWGSQAQTVN